MNYRSKLVFPVCNLCKLCLVIMCCEQQTCPDGRHRVISLEKPLTSARCLSQDSTAISALWVTTAREPGLKPGELDVGWSCAPSQIWMSISKYLAFWYHFLLGPLYKIYSLRFVVLISGSCQIFGLPCMGLQYIPLYISDIKIDIFW